MQNLNGKAIENTYKNLSLKKGISISLLVYLGYLLFYAVYNFQLFLPLILTLFSFLPIHGLLLLILKKGNYLLVRRLFILCSSLFLLILTFYIAGSKTGVHYFLMIFTLLGFSMTDPKQLWLSILYFSLNLFFFAGAEFGFIPERPLMDYPDQLARIIHIQCVLLTFIISYYVSFLFFKINHAKEEVILASNARLNQLNSELRSSEEKIAQQRNVLVQLNEELHTQMDVISKQKDQLQAANATKDKFMSIIAHDLKSPLSSIISISEILDQRLDSFSTDEIQELIHGIHESSSRIHLLLLNLLNWSQTQTGQLQPNKSPFHLQDLIQNNHKLFQQNLKEKHITLSLDLISNDALLCDKDMLDTMIRNLLSNAIKFTPNNGAIRMETKDEAEGLSLHIIDSGIGMQEEQIACIFQADKNCSTPGTNNERGMGLGLRICQEFATLNNCQLKVRSTPGVGSDFYIVFSETCRV